MFNSFPSCFDKTLKHERIIQFFTLITIFLQKSSYPTFLFISFFNIFQNFKRENKLI